MSEYIDTEYLKPSFWEKTLEQLGEKAMSLGLRIIFALLFFFIGTQVIKLALRIIHKAMEKAKADVGVIQFVNSFLKAAMYVILVFMLASYFGVDAASIVALLGSAGVAIGLAIHGSLSNLAGGVLILLLKPFKVGDYIMEGTSGKEGTVIEIRIFYTKLATLDNKEVILPNGSLANTNIVNMTARKFRRIDVPVSISYNADIKKAKEVLVKMLHEDDKTMKDREMVVFVDRLGESGIELVVRFWVENKNYWTGMWQVTEKCKYTLDEAGIEIPYNQLDVHMRSE
ncbi:MAG: mechanosensitive ion channel [Lachnospiraceae bacterium]|nr:mechanosensitive ion channel [Lachnospiraceae bacterium]